MREPILFTYEDTPIMQGIRLTIWKVAALLPEDSATIILPKGAFGRQEVFTFLFFVNRR